MEELNSIIIMFPFYSIRMAHIIGSLALIVPNKMVRLNETIFISLKLV